MTIEGEMMGLFDRFRKRVREVAEEADESDLVASEDSVEAQKALAAAAQLHDKAKIGRASCRERV